MLLARERILGGHVVLAVKEVMGGHVMGRIKFGWPTFSSTSTTLPVSIYDLLYLLYLLA